MLGNFSNENNNSNTLIKNAIVFSGASEQLVTGSYEVKIDTLIVNKSNGSVTLTNQLSIYKKLILIDGFINSDTINILTIKSGGKVTNASDSSFIEGPVAKLGNTSFTFPIGRNGIYNPITISAPTSTTDKFVAEYFDTKSNTPNLDSQFTYIDTCQFWRLRHLAGNSNVNVKMTIDNPCFHIPSINYIGVEKDSSSNTDEWVSAGNTTILTPSTDTLIATLTAHSSWGDITLGKTNPLVVAFAGNDTAICFGESVTLGGAPTGKKGTGALKYKWSPSTGLSNATIANPVATPTETTTYYVVVTDSISEYTKDAVVVIVYPQLVIDAGKTVNLCQYMEIEAGGDPTASGGAAPYNYLWKNEGGDTVTYKSNPTYIADTSRIFYLTVTDSNYCTAVDTFILITNPPLILSASPDTMLYRNETVQLNSTVSGGTAPFNYIWEPSLYLDDSTISNPTCTPLSSMQYQLTVIDSFGCSDEAFANIDFQIINLGSLSSFAAFAVDSISAGDSSIAIGDVGARFIDTTNIAISGTLHTDTTELNSLKAELENIISGVDELRADTINYDLSNITLTSGIYRIDTSAFLNGILTLEGNDSSYFIFDIDGDWTIADRSKIIHPTVADDKVFFSINGNLILGDSLTLNCVFCSGASISGGGFKGNAVMYASKNIIAEYSINRLISEATRSADYMCNKQPILPDIIPVNSILKPCYATTNDFTLVFREEFNDTSLDLLKWGVWGGWGSTWGDPIIPDSRDMLFTESETSPTQNVLFQNGKTRLRVLRNDPGAYFPLTNNTPGFPDFNWKYTASMIKSTADFYHGYFEIRAKMPNQQGIWPAFWLYYAGGDCNHHSEIDFFDAMNLKYNIPYGEIWGIPNSTQYEPCSDNIVYKYCPKDQQGNSVSLNNFNGGFHIYSGEWLANKVKLYIDGEHIATIPNYLALHNNDKFMQLILNTAITYPDNDDLNGLITLGSYPEPTGTNPSHFVNGVQIPGNNNGRDFIIDYARVWTKNNHVFDYYFVDNNGYAFQTTELCEGVVYHLFTANYPTTTFNWIPSTGVTILLNPKPNEIYFKVTGTGSKSVTISAVDETIFGTATPHLETYNFNVIGSIPATPTINYHVNGCYYEFFASGASGANSYIWTLTDGNTYTYTTQTNFFPSLTYFYSTVPYDLSVKAVNACGVSPIAYAYGTCPLISGCRIEDEKQNKFADSILIYPSPSLGNTIVENNMNEDLSLKISFINGQILKNINLHANEKVNNDNLPQGILLFEFYKKNGSIIKRKLISVIKN